MTPRPATPTPVRTDHRRKPDPISAFDKFRVRLAKWIAGKFWTDPRRKATHRKAKIAVKKQAPVSQEGALFPDYEDTSVVAAL